MSLHGGHNKEQIWIRRQAFEIFNVIANTEKSQRNMIFLITIKNLVFDYQMYFMLYTIKKDEYNLTLKDDKIDKLTQLITDQTHKINDIKDQNDELLDKVSELKDILDYETDDKVIDVKSRSLKEHIIVLQKINDATQLKIICGQNMYARRISKESDYIELHDHECYLNSKNLFCRLKERVRKEQKRHYEMKLKIIGSTITLLNGFSREAFIDIIVQLDNDKKKY